MSIRTYKNIIMKYLIVLLIIFTSCSPKILPKKEIWMLKEEKKAITKKKIIEFTPIGILVFSLSFVLTNYLKNGN